MKEHCLYFIAVLAPADVSEEVTAFKQYAASNFESSRALHSPPHITLIPPFSWPVRQLSDVIREVEQLTCTFPPFWLALRNFNCFPPRVIFVDVPQNEALAALQATLSQRLHQQLNLGGEDKRGYHPHMTVAFKDLHRRLFAPAWDYFSKINYERTYEVREIGLLQHNKQEWELIHRFPLNC
ncbi:MAG: 2'-5' RNA ligase family protein [Saprospiraceae bacterium]|nr:2'-5' RNA ligase family protein [Saprospiraceae bacterium]